MLGKQIDHDYYACQDADGNLISKRSPHCAEPWTNKSTINGIAFWTEAENAKEYAERFQGLLTVVRVRLSVVKEEK